LLRKYLDVNIGYFTGPKLNRVLNNYKDASPTALNGVYKIFCNCGTVYIGETKNLENRRKNHEGDLRNKRTNSSAPAEHEFLNPTHKVEMDSIVLLYNEKRWFPRTFIESIFIQKNPNNMNRNTGLDISSWLPFVLQLID
jgi:predicted GIY-YIG superfamily endonuclease